MQNLCEMAAVKLVLVIANEGNMAIAPGGIKTANQLRLRNVVLMNVF